MSVAVMPRTRLAVTPLSGTIGARIDGLDLARPIDDETMRELRQVFLEHLVLVIPGQAHITPDQHIAFAARWGDLHVMPSGHMEGYDRLIKITYGGIRPGPDGKDRIPLNDAEKYIRTDAWHSDMSFQECPPVGSLLLAREIPPAGGDTMFANQYVAYETLSAGMKRMLDGLKAVHKGESWYSVVGLDPAKAPANIHPVVRTHPETGRRALYVNRVFTSHFEDMTVEESRPLLEYVFAHASQPNYTFRHRWSVGDLVFWDNRCAQHFAVWDYGRQTRIMHRATVLGDRPT